MRKTVQKNKNKIKNPQFIIPDLQRWVQLLLLSPACYFVGYLPGCVAARLLKDPGVGFGKALQKVSLTNDYSKSAQHPYLLLVHFFPKHQGHGETSCWTIGTFIIAEDDWVLFLQGYMMKAHTCWGCGSGWPDPLPPGGQVIFGWHLRWFRLIQILEEN